MQSRSRAVPLAVAVALTLAFLVMPCAPALAAEEPSQPTVFQHWVMWPKAGQAPEFEEAVKAHLAWRKAAGEGFGWSASQTVVGNDLTPYVFRAGPFHWKDLDAQAEWGVKAEALANWNEQVAAHVDRVEHYLMVWDPEHSLWTDGEEYRYFGVSLLRLKPGVNLSFIDALKRLHKIAAEKEWSHPWGVQWVVGGSEVDLAVVNPYRSYAEMAEPEPPFVKLAAETLGSEQGAKDLLTQFWASIETSNYLISAPRPDLSTRE